jgi:hypothetical protein
LDRKPWTADWLDPMPFEACDDEVRGLNSELLGNDVKKGSPSDLDGDFEWPSVL